ncbi:MAG: prepilin-type N-terminal cleavage/methylation domain-containing protein [bacterium]|nr:prepilin-type N-terminal cleavage/methylation domain-containing protein [bacterium]
MKHGGFTLIELLVAVTVIGVLAIIAIPNFINARTYAQVGRAYNDLHAIAYTLTTYHIDWNGYPLSVSLETKRILPHEQRLQPLTPNYLSTIPRDIFRPDVPPSYLERYGWQGTNRYEGEAPPVNGMDSWFFEVGSWVISSVGPAISRPDISDGYDLHDVYDPTNGINSLGVIVQWGG